MKTQFTISEKTENHIWKFFDITDKNGTRTELFRFRPIYGFDRMLWVDQDNTIYHKMENGHFWSLGYETEKYKAALKN
jgi:hypothetical protein